MAEALYRKYRPQVFADVVGQGHIVSTLQNAIERDRVSHAYLFCGPRGTGKTTMARLLSKALLCEHAPTAEPDGTCEDCQLIAQGIHPDVYELDAASRTGVENVREEIISRVSFAPTRGARKVYIIDEVHMLSVPAFNALLKTLEEPPDHVVFILCTTDPQKVLGTIQSRCQRFDFRRIGLDDMAGKLKSVCEAEGVTFADEALELVANRADGGMRNALTALEQLISFSGGDITLESANDMLGSLDTTDLADIMDAIGRRDAAACFTWVANYVETGGDMATFASDMAQHVRNLYVMSLAGADVALDVGESVRTQMVGELKLFGPDRLARMLMVLGDLILELKTSTNARLSFEVACTRLVRPDSDLTLEALAERVEHLERRVAAGGVAAAASEAGEMPTGSSHPAAKARAQLQDALAKGTSQPGKAGADGGAVSRDGRADAVVNAASAAPGEAAASAMPGGAAVSATPAASGASGGFAAPTTSASSGEPPASAASGMRKEAVASAAPASSAASVAPAASSAPSMSTAPADGGARVPQEGVGQAQQAGAPAWEAAASNPIALQRIWKKVLGVMKHEREWGPYAVFFTGTRAVLDASAHMLRIEFPAQSEFAFRTAQKPEIGNLVAQALKEIVGCDVPFACRLGFSDMGSAGASNGGQPLAGAVQARGGAASGGSVGLREGNAPAVNTPSASGTNEPSWPAPASGLSGEGARPKANVADGDVVRFGTSGASNSVARPNASGNNGAGAWPGANGAAGTSPNHPSEPVPYDDQVPLDVYDDFAPAYAGNGASHPNRDADTMTATIGMPGANSDAPMEAMPVRDAAQNPGTKATMGAMPAEGTMPNSSMAAGTSPSRDNAPNPGMVANAAPAEVNMPLQGAGASVMAARDNAPNPGMAAGAHAAPTAQVPDSAEGMQSADGAWRDNLFAAFGDFTVKPKDVE